MINGVLNFLANDQWHEIDCNFPEIPLVGHCISYTINDEIECTEWIVTSIIHHILRKGGHAYVEIECKPKS